MTQSATYTHGHPPSVLRSHTWRTAENSAAFLLPHLRADMSLLDIGCGPGTITADLARRMPKGSVLGIDAAASVIDKARAHCAQAEVDNVELRVDDVYGLDIPDDTFDVVHAHQVLQHLGDPVAALVEMRRVCRPGGLVAARDGDFGAMTWYPELPKLERWRELYSAAARANGGEPHAGRRLRHWALAAGFEEITTSASCWSYATNEECTWWSDLWADRITVTQLADRIVDLGLADRRELATLAEAWRSWAGHPDACFFVPNVEILCQA